MYRLIQPPSLVAAIALLALCVPAGAQSSLSADAIRQGEARQQQIRNQIQQVTLQLEAIIEEFRRNGLDGEDVQVLEAIRRVLGNLSEEDMQRVISALQESRSLPSPDASEKAFAGAVSGQKIIVVKLRQLLLEYQRQQALYDLSLRLLALAKRQDGNMWATVDVAKAAKGRTGTELDDSQRASIQVLHAEQQALRDEINPLLTKLEALLQEGDSVSQERLRGAMELCRTGGLRPPAASQDVSILDTAVGQLKAGKLYDAASMERIIRDQIRELARRVAPPKDSLAALEQAARDLQKSIQAQKQLMDATRGMDRDRRRNDAPDLARQQTQQADQADQIRRDLETVAPDAAESVKAAIDQMLEAHSDLQAQRRDPAMEDQKAALAKLEEAKKSVDQALAKAAPATQPVDKLAAALQLQERTRELIRQEEQLKTQTAASNHKAKELRALARKQEAVESETRELQKEVAAQLPEAARSVGEAATQMDKAQESLSKSPEAKPAQEAQAAAISSLKQAEEQLTKQVQELEQAKQELAALQDSRDKVIKIIGQQQKVEMSTAKAAARNDAAKELANPQGQLAKDTEQVRTEMPDSEKTAAQPLEDARRNMDEAKGRLDSSDPKTAHPAQQQAMANLYKAKDALDKRMQELERQLGQPPQDSADLANAMEKLEAMQKQVAEAAEKVDAAAPAKSVEQQQREIAEALGQMPRSDANAKPLEQAQKAAAQAANHLQQREMGQAVQQMNQAMQGMQQAMAAQPSQQGEQAPKTAQPQQDQQDQQSPQDQQPQKQQESQAAQNQSDEGQPGQGSLQKPASLTQLAARQAALKAAVEQMGQPSSSGMQEAAAGFEQAAADAGQMAAGNPEPLPGSASEALQEAAKSLSSAAAAASSKNAPGAQSAAGQAQAALAKAAAALSLAQSGLSGQTPSNQGQSQANGQKSGQQPGRSQSAQPGQQPGDQPSEGPSRGNRKGNDPGNFAEGGPRRDEKTAGQFLGLPERDRKAILQSQSDKYPEEYGPQIEQYLRNLAEPENE